MSRKIICANSLHIEIWSAITCVWHVFLIRIQALIWPVFASVAAEDAFTFLLPPESKLIWTGRTWNAKEKIWLICQQKINDFHKEYIGIRNLCTGSCFGDIWNLWLTKIYSFRQWIQETTPQFLNLYSAEPRGFNVHAWNTVKQITSWHIHTHVLSYRSKGRKLKKY